MILTEEILNEGMSSNGSWSVAQIKCFGTTPQNNKGWKYQILGKEFEPEVIEKFLGLRDKHLKKSDISQHENDMKILWLIFAYSWFGGKLKDYQSNSKNYEGELPLRK